MATSIRIKRRAAGGAVGAPASLLNGELAFNEQDQVLYYGKGTGVGGQATSIIPIGGDGAYAKLNGGNTWTGDQVIQGDIAVNGNIDYLNANVQNFPLGKLSDCTISTPNTGHTLFYDGASNRWYNAPAGSVSVYAIDGTTVDATPGANISAKIVAALINDGQITGTADLNSGDICVVSGNIVGVSGSYIWDGVAFVNMPSGGGGGTVSSVGVSVPAWLNVANTPVTTSGTIAITSPDELQGLVLASPESGTGQPSFRALSKTDMPANLTDDFVSTTRVITVEDGLTIGTVTNPAGTQASLDQNVFIGIGTIDGGTF